MMYQHFLENNIKIDNNITTYNCAFDTNRIYNISEYTTFVLMTRL